MGKFDAISKRATGCNNGVSEAQNADVNAEIDRASGAHIGGSIPRNTGQAASIPGTENGVVVKPFYRCDERESPGDCVSEDDGAGMDEEPSSASYNVRPSRVASVIPHRVASVGAISAGVADS